MHRTTGLILTDQFSAGVAKSKSNSISVMINPNTPLLHLYRQTHAVTQYTNGLQVTGATVWINVHTMNVFAVVAPSAT